MKIKLLLLVFAFVSCKNESKPQDENQVPSVSTIERGEQLFTENNCAACHKIDQKVIGPSLQEIAKIYKEQNGNMVAFLKEEAPPIVDETMYETMKINLQITKTMTEIELKSLEEYIYSQGQ